MVNHSLAFVDLLATYKILELKINKKKWEHAGRTHQILKLNSDIGTTDILNLKYNLFVSKLKALV